ncbi:hypothetical protein GE061_004154 [Apolygus lucorum]|uniref:Cytochrome P450 n=1 Tax=Apolygus lucorum TaxID=248454 RepID=A0A8S9WZW3_APOLU|nr:hypothetical protein GE061_004154 [Apolygus lucorum]
MEPQIHLKTSALNVINETAMGTVIEENIVAGRKYLEAVKRIVPTTMKRMTTNWMKNEFLFNNFSSLSKPYNEDIVALQDFVHNVIKARRAAFIEEKQAESPQYSGEKKRRVFLDSLLELSTKENFDDDAILDEVHTFMLVGHHTTMSAAQYLLLRLAENPEIQERAYQEQMEIFGSSELDATRDDLSKMSYLEKVIKETLRMNPPIPEISRLLIQDVTLSDGQVVPEGTKVAINVFLTHRNPKYWEDPDTFNPDRFDSEACKDRHPFSYIPFSAGPRNCIAFKFAQPGSLIELDLLTGRYIYTGPTDQPFFIGASRELANIKPEDRISYMKDKFDEFGGWFTCYAMGQPWFLVSDPEISKVFLMDNINIDKAPEYSILKDMLHQGLVSLSGDKWRMRRKLLTPSFHFEILQNSLECFKRNWKKAIDGMINSKDAPMEPLGYLSSRTLFIVNESAMGTVIEDTGASGREYLSALSRVVPTIKIRMVSIWMKSDFLFNSFSSLSKPYMRDINNIQEFVYKVIKERKAALTEEKLAESSQHSEAKGRKRRVFLDSLLELSDEENFDDDEILDEVHTFMFAGTHTSSIAAQYLMLRLAENPDIQERAYQEQLDIFGNSKRDATRDDLSKMRYLDKVIKESLRLHPPVPEVGRLLIQDVTLPDGQVVPKGTKVSINIFLTHRNPKYWEDPDTFNPDRFDSEVCKDRHPFSYIPFSAGPRNCIASKFALMSNKMLGSLLLRNCKLSAVTRSEDLKYKVTTVLECTTPIMVRVEPRSL